MENIDTIAAVSTPKGESAIAMLRASGSQCGELCDSIFRSKRPALPRQSYHGSYRSIEGDLLDDVVYCLYREPKSFTGEDTLEIMCHGNPLIAAKILEDLLARGCRQAEPGEFSRRAFLNGRMDLTQAEAVMELIQARSDKAIQAANNQLRGAFGRQLGELKDKLLRSIAAIEAYIDFPEEDLPPEQKKVHVNGIQELIQFCSRLIDSSKYAAFLRDGVKTHILGEPNAGKSSLLNQLLGFERAIVSEEPGTTRDFLRERIILGSHSIQLLDTAGLREAKSGIEREGIRRTIELAEEADIFLLVEDSALPSPELPESIAQRLNSSNCIVIRNKVDLGNALSAVHTIDVYREVAFSALTGEGLDELKSALIALIDSHFSSDEDDLILVNARHNAALAELKDCLSGALAKFETDDAVELIASDMRGALDAIGAILGRIDNEAMLDVLFSSFCIGK
ncbi:MAG: tRNA uridine-5-carboxymethylaminomethyl(34) synthesis GTPase MnmE [Opitutales bacterium]